MKTHPLIPVLITLLVAAFGLLGWRVYYLQHDCRDQYLQKARLPQHSTVIESPKRGDIFDRRSRVLAGSSKTEQLFAEPRAFKTNDQILECSMQLQDILGVPGPDICRLIQESRNPGFVRLYENLSADQRQEILKARLSGIGIQGIWQRSYPMGAVTSHLIGFVGAEQKGFGGIEQKYDADLQGTAGSDVLVVDVGRNPIRMDSGESRVVQNGYSLVLTIDTVIQDIVRKALQKQVKEYEAEYGLGVVMDPWTGEILAMVSLPDYDPMNFSEYADRKNDPLKNRVLADPYEPGSIFKPIAAAVGLNTGAIGYNEVIFCENGYFSRYKISEYMNHVYGNLSIKMIIAKSSNIGMAKVGLKLGQKRLYDGLRLFGFGQPTGLDLPGEDAGIFRPTRQWDGWTVTRIPFGHAISVTAIQILRAYCIIANGGSAVAPHIVKAVVDDQGTIKRFIYPAPLTGYVIKPEVAKWIREEALVAVINEGTGDQAKLKDIQAFGKTGTANIALANRKGYDTANYVASFVGGAPPDKPEVMVLVSIGKPNRALGKGYSGGRVAAPVFKEVMEEILKYRHSQQPEQ
jgi:cell division protein FtsI/penicillin-binding protein 2